MRVKDGKVKLQPGDVQVGNFVYSREGNRICLSDIGGVMSMSLDIEASFAGEMMQQVYLMAKEGDEGARKYLHTYAAVMYNVHTVVPVEKKEFSFFGRLIAVCEEGLKFEKDVYGLKDDISDEEDKKILDEVREMEKATDAD